jgi:3-methyladenine DNA glycosylase AlkD
MTAEQALERLKELGDPEAARGAGRYFKTEPGEYGEGDRFLGVRAAPLRKLAREVEALPLGEVKKLLASEWHEARSLALLVLVSQFGKADAEGREAIHRLYLRSTGRVNGWDLVDVSAEHLVGAYLDGRPRDLLDRLAGSASLWERRIAVLASRHFLRRGQFDDTLRLARRLLGDREDLIHKAVGWMLREVGERDLAALEGFLREHHRAMPRTMLRYAIEHFPPEKRRRYLKGEV